MADLSHEVAQEWAQLRGNTKRTKIKIKIKAELTLFDMGIHDGSQNVFDHCAQTFRRRKLKLGDF